MKHFFKWIEFALRFYVLQFLDCFKEKARTQRVNEKASPYIYFCLVLEIRLLKKSKMVHLWQLSKLAYHSWNQIVTVLNPTHAPGWNWIENRTAYSCKYRNSKLPYNIKSYFNCIRWIWITLQEGLFYLLSATFGHYRGDSLTQSMSINAFLQFHPKVTGSLIASLVP